MKTLARSREITQNDSVEKISSDRKIFLSELFSKESVQCSLRELRCSKKTAKHIVLNFQSGLNLRMQKMFTHPSKSRSEV